MDVPTYDGRGRRVEREFDHYETDRRGNLYGVTAGGEVLPTGWLVPSLGGRSDITQAEIDALADE